MIEEYLQRRGHSDIGTSNLKTPTGKLHAYVKPPSNESMIAKKPLRAPKEVTVSTKKDNGVPTETSEQRNIHKTNQGSSRKKKTGKVVNLAEAAKGSIVFQQGKPCSCQARRHRLVSNCLSCGKIVCEQEGEGPCSFCGALVLKEGSQYAGLDEGVVPLSDAEAAAEAYAKRLVEYDRDSAARTTVIDDQSDYYEIEGNSWLSIEVFKFVVTIYTINHAVNTWTLTVAICLSQEKELLRKKKEEIEEAEQAKRSKVIVSFDLVGRKVVFLCHVLFI